MKNIVTGILSLVLVGLLAADNWSVFSAASTRENLQNLDLLVCVFLFIISLYLFGLAAKTKQVSQVVKESQVSDTSNGSGLVLYFLSLLQEKGRLLDFVMDDIAAYSDEQVGRVARVVHQGVKDVLDETMKIEPVHSGNEGDTISVAKDFNVVTCRLVGNHSAQPPFSGKVLHRGWKAKKISLPTSVGKALADSDVVQPMELEVA